MAELKHEQKLKILEKWNKDEATEEEIKMAGGETALLKLMFEMEPDKPKGSKHIYSPGEFSLWGD